MTKADFNSEPYRGLNIISKLLAYCTFTQHQYVLKASIIYLVGSYLSTCPPPLPPSRTDVLCLASLGWWASSAFWSSYLDWRTEVEVGRLEAINRVCVGFASIVQYESVVKYEELHIPVYDPKSSSYGVWSTECLPSLRIDMKSLLSSSGYSEVISLQ